MVAAPDALSQELEFLRSTFRAVPAFVVRADADLRIRLCNHFQPGLTEADVIGRSVFDFTDPSAASELSRAIDEARRSGHTVRYRSVGVGPNGSKAYYESTVYPIQEGDGPAGIGLVANDVTALVSAAEALRESEERLRLIVDATGVGLWRMDLATGHVEWTDAMRRITGSDTPLSPEAYLNGVVVPEDRHIVEQDFHRLAMGSTQLEWPKHRVQRPDGSIRYVVNHGAVLTDDENKPNAVVGVCLDLTEKHAFEQQLLQVQKMEAVGSLTAGIAHNFNNMLMVIMPTLELAKPQVDEKTTQLVDGAILSAKRAAEIVRGLMTFAGQRLGSEKTQINLVDTIRAAVAMCTSAFDRRIALETESPRYAPCNVNGPAIEQLMMNLLINARDAVIEANCDNPEIRIELQEEASFWCVRVSDNGRGIPDAIRERIFEPFFTTKDIGKGTGLGLSTCYAIARDHGGTLTCESNVKRGATFVLRLPKGAVLAQESPSERSERRILVVDDEETVLAVAERALEGLGHHVICVQSVRGGLDTVKAAIPELILLDYSMPGSTGESAIALFRKHCPNARIVFFTGQFLSPDIAALADGVLNKPVSIENLLSVVNENLARRSSS